jgi:hypothetical protein
MAGVDMRKLNLPGTRLLLAFFYSTAKVSL